MNEMIIYFYYAMWLVLIAAAGLFVIRLWIFVSRLSDPAGAHIECAVLAERMRCAKIAEDLCSDWGIEIANKIRNGQ